MGALAIFVLGVLAALAEARRVDEQRERDARTRFEHDRERLERRVRERWQRLEHALEDVRGLFLASASVEADEFRAFIDSGHVAAGCEGALGLGFVRRVPGRHGEPFEADSYRVEFFEPLAPLGAADLGVDEACKSVLVGALGSGEATLAEPIALDADDEGARRCLYLLPVFARGSVPRTPAERARALVGFAFAALQLDAVVADVARAANGFLDLELYEGRDAARGTPLHDHLPDTHAARFAGLYEARIPLAIGGRDWTLWLGTTPAFDAAYSRAPARILAGVGSLASLLLALLVFALAQSRQHAVKLAAGMTSELRASEASARAALNRLASFRAALDDQMIVAVTDTTGVLTEVNALFCRISGYERSALLGAKHDLLRSGVHGPEFWARMWADVSAGRVWREDVCNRAANGELYWVDLSIGPLHGADGRCAGYVSIGADISQRKRAEQALARMLQVLDEMSLVARVGGWELDSETGQVTWTKEIYRIFELDDGFVPTLASSLSFFPEESRAIVARHVAEAAETGRPFDYTVPFVTAKGRALWVRGRGKAEPSAAGGTRLYGAFQDVTADHQRNADLLRALDEAQAASRVKSEFLANMSHEIRTPMNGILGMSELALDTELTAEQRAYLETVVECASSLLAIVDDVLDLSKLEAGKLGLVTDDFDLVACVESAVGILAPRAAAKELALVCHVASDVPRWLHGDTCRLRQVLTNLIGNAVKFTEEGEVEVAVRVRESVREEATLVFSVRDTGIGIAPEHQSAIFESFTQVDGTSTRKHGGTGLGLTISRQLVAAMGGKLRVESAPGRGSTFSFELRLARAESAAHEHGSDHGRRGGFGACAPAATPPAAVAGSPCFRGRVLVVEDNLVNTQLVLGLLRKLGCEATLAENGLRALDVLARERFDLVLMDLQMPVMGGIEAARRIRSRESGTGEHVPIVALTARAMKDDERACRQAGMDDYLAKPIRAAGLRAVLQRWLGAATPRERSQPPARGGVEPVVLDVEEALVRLEGDRRLLDQALDAFRRTVPRTLAALRAAAAGADVRALASVAHDLKGEAAGLCAEPVRCLAERLEDAALGPRLEEVPELAGALERSLQDLLAEVERRAEGARHGGACS